MERVKILIVEDESIVAMEIKSGLLDLGYAVSDVVSSGPKALEKVAAQRPNLVLMDIKLKGEMDGIETASLIRARFHTPFIYLTAYADDEMLERASVTEPFGYLLKPFSDRELHSAIVLGLYRSKMERKLKKSAQWIFATLKSIGHAVIATDAKSCIRFMNGTAQSLTGWSLQEALGRELPDVFHIVNAETGEALENPAAQTMRASMVLKSTNAHLLLIDRTGKETLIENSAAPIKYNKETIVGAVMTFRSITGS